MMSVDLMDVITGLLGAGLMVLGWFGRELWGMVKELKEDVASLRELLPRDYVAKGEFKDHLNEVKNLLIRIDTKLDTKQDKGA